jgi:arylsulfatase A-like enzyme
LRDNNFHTTAICGPSRAALITGRNHHNAGSGFLAEWATGVARFGIDTFGVGKDTGSPVSI